MYGYDELIKSFNYDILFEDSDDAYQGDMYFIFKDYRRVGILVAGFGSCSYCDAYQAAEEDRDYSLPWFNHAPLRELANSLFNSIRWFASIQEAIEYVNVTNDYWSHTSIKPAMLEALNKVNGQYE